MARLLAAGIPTGPPEVRKQPAKPRQRQTRLGKSQVAALVADYQSGMTAIATAKKHHVCEDTVVKWLRVSGVELRPAETGIPREQMAEAAALHAAGWSYRKIARHYGCADTTVRKHLKRYVPGVDETS